MTFSSFVISKPNIYCLIRLPFLLGTSGKFKSLFEHLKAEKTQSMLPDFSLPRPTRISEKKNNLNTKHNRNFSAAELFHIHVL